MIGPRNIVGSSSPSRSLAATARGLLGGVALLVSLASCAGSAVEVTDADTDAAADAEAKPTSCDGRPRSHCVRGVSLGTRFGCAALRDQTVWCWGRNDESQLGYESTDLCPERLSNGQTRAVACHMYPLQVTGLAGAVAVSAGRAHACARLGGARELRCWGSNTHGQLGRGSTLPSRVPVPVSGLMNVISVAAGSDHTCAVIEGGAVYCWGSNSRGQLGVTAPPHTCEVGGMMVPCARVPVAVSGVSDAVEVVAGESHTCARTSVGRVWCWGSNNDAQLGAGTANAMPMPAPQRVLLGASPLRAVRSLAAGANHTCATREDGAVLCWGRHDRGQLGVAVPESFAPCAHACVMTAVPIVGYEGSPSTEDPDGGWDDPDATWDDPDGGEAPTDAGRAMDGGMDGGTPRDAGVRDATGARDGATDRDGDSDDAALELDAGHDSGLPAAPTAASIAAGGAFSCLSLSDGTLRCWGTNRTYELGNGMVNEGGPTLTTVIASPGSAATNPLQGVIAVEAGASTTCALLGDFSLRCWGSNETGALGIGNVSEQNGPVSMTW